MARNKYFRGRYLFLLLISLLFIFFSFYFRNQIGALGNLGLLGIFLINLIGSATLFVPGPTIASVIAGGFVFHPLMVALVASLGSALGDMVGYVLGRAGKEVFVKNHPNWYHFLRDILHRFGAIIIIFISFIPNPFFDAVGIIAGIFSYSPTKFFIYVFIGRIFRNVILAYFGAAL